MAADDQLFALNRRCAARMELVGGRIPVLIADDFYADADAVRGHALSLPFAPPPYPYPGALAEIDEANSSLTVVRNSILGLINREYLSRIPPIQGGGKPITAFARVMTDFARTDVHPNDLSADQRRPHVDPVPIFGLVYLNREERGGTLFFRNTAEPADDDRVKGYVTGDIPGFELIGGIEGRFNRLAVYPGFVPHTGQIEGEWIEGDERFAEPRLTQRFVFFP
jgi:uncharacterized protein DUF6445